MPNRRLFYAVRQIGFAQIGTSTFVEAHGVQTIGMTTTFNLEQVFEQGQIAIYDNIEGIPDVQVTMQKVLDGYCPLWLLATAGAPAATLAGRSAQKTIVGMSVFTDTNTSSSGTPVAQVTMSGMVPSSLSYTFPVDGNFTEDMTCVGNDKVWNTLAPFTFSGRFLDNADSPVAIAGSGGVNRRQNLIFGSLGTTLDANSQVIDANATILPRQVAGISSSGTNNRDANGDYFCHAQSISVSTDLGREEIFELGRKAPYFRFATFPVQVQTAISIISTSGDFISATEAGVFAGGLNTRNETIRVATKEGLRLYLGLKNRLQSVEESGGDTGGGNVTLTYNYVNFNDLEVTHWNDVTTALAPAQGGTGGT